MHIEYSLIESDFVVARQFSMHGRTWWKKLRLWLIRIVGLVFAIMGGLLLRQSYGEFANILVNLFVLGYGILLCFFSLYTKLRSKVIFRKMAQLHGSYRVDLNETGIHYIAPAGESRVEWRAWSTFAEDASTFVLVQRGGGMFMPIPKRELTPTQITDLRSLFETHLPTK